MFCATAHHSLLPCLRSARDLVSLLLQRKEPVPSGNDKALVCSLLVRVIVPHVILLPLPFGMHGGPLEGISLHFSVMGGAGLWKNWFWAYICPVPANTDGIGHASTMWKVAPPFLHVWNTL